MTIETVTEELQFSDAKEAFAGVDDDTMFGKMAEHNPQVLKVLFRSGTGYEDIIDICIGKRKSPENLVHETLKCLCSIPKTKWHSCELRDETGS